jgi:ABC-type nickel/cobalt efflux system permease component RcnA
MLWRAFRSLSAFRRHDHAHPVGSHGCASCEALTRKTGGRSGWLAAAIGIVPCTGALLVMLYGLANDLVGPAIVMVIAISLGMAVAMAALGIAAIWGHNRAAARWNMNAIQQTRFTIGAQFAGATAVTVIGTLLFTLTLSALLVP